MRRVTATPGPSKNILTQVGIYEGRKKYLSSNGAGQRDAKCGTRFLVLCR